MRQLVGVLSVLLVCVGYSHAAEKPLTNEDVVKLVDAGLGEDLISCKDQTVKDGRL